MSEQDVEKPPAKKTAMVVKNSRASAFLQRTKASSSTKRSTLSSVKKARKR